LLKSKYSFLISISPESPPIARRPNRSSSDTYSGPHNRSKSRGEPVSFFFYTYIKFIIHSQSFLPRSTPKISLIMFCTTI